MKARLAQMEAEASKLREAQVCCLLNIIASFQHYASCISFLLTSLKSLERCRGRGACGEQAHDLLETLQAESAPRMCEAGPRLCRPSAHFEGRFLHVT